MMNCFRDRLPSNIPPQYFHKIKTDFKNQAKAYLFLHPFVALKETNAQGGKKHNNLHISLFNVPHHATFLQLIPLLNASYKLDVKCVYAETKRHEWSIIMNDAQSVYLETYYKIDLMYHLIKSCRVFYR